MATKWVNGQPVEVSPAEEAAFEAARAPNLSKLKRALRALVRERRRRAEEAGVAVGQNTVETTQEFRQQLRELRDWLADNPGQQVPVRLANGRVVRVGTAQVLAAMTAIRDHVRACMEAEAGHLEAIEALADVAAAQSYNVESGWPA